MTAIASILVVDDECQVVAARLEAGARDVLATPVDPMVLHRKLGPDLAQGGSRAGPG